MTDGAWMLTLDWRSGWDAGITRAKMLATDTLHRLSVRSCGHGRRGASSPCKGEGKIKRLPGSGSLVWMTDRLYRGGGDGFGGLRCSEGCFFDLELAGREIGTQPDGFEVGLEQVLVPFGYVHF